MKAVGERTDAVIAQARGSAPHHDVAVNQTDRLRSIGAALAAEEKDGRQAQRYRDDGRRVVALVLVLVEREAGAGLVAVDEARVGREAGKTSEIRGLGREADDGLRHRPPG